MSTGRYDADWRRPDDERTGRSETRKWGRDRRERLDEDPRDDRSDRGAPGWRDAPRGGAWRDEDLGVARAGGRAMPTGMSPYGTQRGESFDAPRGSMQGRGPRDVEQGGDRGLARRAADEVASWFGDEQAGRRRAADHRGKGPKGYVRSDARIAEDVNDRLSDDPVVDASDVTVEVAEGEVTLSGEVDSRAARRRAEDCVEAVAGVRHVQNNLRVRVADPGRR
jgi:osmotically-inducible protein OsmY